MRPERRNPPPKCCHERSRSVGDFSSSSFEAEIVHRMHHSQNRNVRDRFGNRSADWEPKVSDSLKIRECLAEASADCAALCCCPFTLLHLARLMFLKVPAAVARKLVTDFKRKLKKRKVKGVDGGRGQSDLSLRRSWSFNDYFKGDDVFVLTSEKLDQQFLREYFHLGAQSCLNMPGRDSTWASFTTRRSQTKQLCNLDEVQSMTSEDFVRYCWT